MPYIIKNEATSFVLDSNADKQVYAGSSIGCAYQHWQFAGTGFWLVHS